MAATKLKAHELRSKNKEELTKQADELKNELGALRTAKVSGQGAAARLAKIKVIRKSIARVLTVQNQGQRDALRKQYRKRTFKPLDLRPKKTRAIRRALCVSDLKRKTLKQIKKEAYYGLRKFAIKA